MDRSGESAPKRQSRARRGAMTVAMQAFMPPPAMTARRALRVARVDGGRILSETLVHDRLTVGSSERCDLVVSEMQPTELFVCRQGTWVLQGAVGLRGKLSDGQRTREFGETGVESLSPQARGRLCVGDVQLLFQLVVPPPPVSPPKLPAAVRGGLSSQVDWRFTSIATTIFLGMFAFLLTLENADWPMPRGPIAVAHEALLRFDEPLPPEDESWTQQDSQDVQPSDTPDNAVARNDNAPSSPGEDVVARPMTANQRARIADEVATAVALALGSVGDGGAIQDLLASPAPTDDAASVLAQVSGVRSHASNDRLRAINRQGSGVEGRVDLVGRHTGAADEGSELHEVTPGRASLDRTQFEPDVPGEFDDALVLRRVRAKQRIVQRCYEHELTHTGPGLAGRLRVELTIMPAGVVRSRAEDNATGSASLARCVTSALNRIRFSSGPDAPVSYYFPFVFAPQN